MCIHCIHFIYSSYERRPYAVGAYITLPLVHNIQYIFITSSLSDYVQ